MKESAVCGNSVAGMKQQNIARNNISCIDQLVNSISTYPGLWCGHIPKCFNCLFGFILLYKTKKNSKNNDYGDCNRFETMA